MIRVRLIAMYIILFHIFGFSPEIVEATKTNSPLQMKVHFIEVGQGDSILIETPTKRTILIDGGPPEAGKEVFKFLKKRQIKKIDLLISTHPHIDHIGGLQQIMNKIPIDEIIDSGKTHKTRTYERYKKQIEKKNIPTSTVKRGDRIKIDPLLNIHVLNSYEKGKTNNESAIALHIIFNKTRFLLMSDVEKRQEREIMERHSLKSDIIKIGHHGSKTSSSLAFLQSVRPKIAMLTYDVDNKFGHPTQTVINNLHHLDVDIYSTAIFGHTTIVTDGYEYLLLPERSPVQNLIQ